MDVARFRELDTILKPYGYQLKTAHPFFLPEKSENRRSDGQKSAWQDALSGKENRAFEIKKYNHDEIQQFKGNEQFNEAFCFDENSPDMLAVAAISKGKIIGMGWCKCGQHNILADRNQHRERGGRQRNCLSVSENIERGHRKIGKSSLLWNQHVQSCITAGCCKRRI